MEKRKITVVQTKDQKKSVIMSAATTLGELKADLRINGIDYGDMAFFEGISKTELKADSSVLPHDIPYKGQITNELVFMLTNTNKKIKSGYVEMSRAEAYSVIKSMGLQDACVKKFGKNFTMCKTIDLITLIQSNSNSKPVSVKAKKEEKVETTTTTVAPANNSCECVDNVARSTISRLVDILEHNYTIEDYEKKEILGILDGEAAVAASSEKHESKSNYDSSYSNDEIDDMFSDMGI